MPGQTATLSFALEDKHFAYRLQGSLGKAKGLHLFAHTKAPQVAATLVRGTTSIGTATLANGEGVIIPAAQSGAPGSFDPRGLFELRFDTNAFDDLWVVLDWSPAAE